jgi:hypothetical protein
MVNTRRLLSFLGDALGISQLISQAAAQYGLDPSLVMAMAQRESNLNPNAVSPAGAQGIMQLMPATAAALGVTNPFDAAQNIAAGVRYLAQLLNQFGGDLAKALAAYNWGPGALSKAIQQWGADWLAHTPAETQRYVQALTGIVASAPAATPASSESAPSTAPLTIDAATGEVIQDDTPTPAAVPSWIPQTPQGRILLLTGAAIGVYLLAETFFED